MSFHAIFVAWDSSTRSAAITLIFLHTLLSTGLMSLPGAAKIANGINRALSSSLGGDVDMNDGSVNFFKSDEHVFAAGVRYNFRNNSWGNTHYGSYEASIVGYVASEVSGQLLSPSSVHDAINQFRAKAAWSDLLAALKSNNIGVKVEGMTDWSSFNLTRQFDKFYTTAFYDEIFLAINPNVLTFRADIMRLTIPYIYIGVKAERKVGIADDVLAKVRLGSAFDGARSAVFDTFWRRSISPATATEIFMYTLNENLRFSFPMKSLVPQATLDPTVYSGVGGSEFAKSVIRFYTNITILN